MIHLEHLIIRTILLGYADLLTLACRGCIYSPLSYLCSLRAKEVRNTSSLAFLHRDEAAICFYQATLMLIIYALVVISYIRDLPYHILLTTLQEK